MKRKLQLLGAVSSVLLGACLDRSPLASAPPPTSTPLTDQRLECLADVHQQTIVCGSAISRGSRRATIIGGQNTYIRLASSGVAFDSTTEILRADVTLQNLLPSALGTADGMTPDTSGIRVFFASGPVVTAGWGAVTVANPDGFDAFTGSAQPFFRYPPILASGQTSAPRIWQFQLDSLVSQFAFTVYVSAQVAPALVINEIMAHPTTANEAAGEWFELANPSITPVDLKGWTIASGGDGGHTISSSVMVPAHGFVVLGGSTAAGQNGGAPINYAYSGINLGNTTSDWLALRSPGGITVDSVNWGAASGETASTPPTGVSLQLDTTASDNTNLSGSSSHWIATLTTFGTAGQRGTPGGRTLQPLAGAAWISAESAHSCMTDTAGLAFCWGGHNTYGELGNGTTTQPPLYAVVAIQPHWIQPYDPAKLGQVVTGPNSSCAVLSTGGPVFCWGINVPIGAFQLGNRSVPTALGQQGAGLITLTGVGSFFGNSSSCGSNGNRIWCWGADTTHSMITEIPYPITQDGAGVYFDRVSVGFSSPGTLCALTAGQTAIGPGFAYCRGYGPATGAGLSAAVTVDSFVHVQQPAGVTFTTISTNGATTCALSTLGQAYCWGVNSAGQLGDATTTLRTAPVIVQHPPSVRFESIVVGRTDHVCGVATTGQAYCWGGNAFGKLGTGLGAVFLSTPTAVAQPAGVLFSAIAPGGDHTCAIEQATGHVYCWGRNDLGQLGDGTTTSRPTPVPTVR